MIADDILILVLDFLSDREDAVSVDLAQSDSGWCSLCCGSLLLLGYSVPAASAIRTSRGCFKVAEPTLLLLFLLLSI